MPLNPAEDYERLGEHLSGIDAPLEAFARDHGYTVYPHLSGGRYPNRRITQESPIFRSIQFSMDNAPGGERFDRFFSEIPYTIFAVAWIDDFTTLTRWQSPGIRIDGVPLSVLMRTLPIHLQHFHRYLQGITEQYIRECARTSHLSPQAPVLQPR